MTPARRRGDPRFVARLERMEVDEQTVRQERSWCIDNAWSWRAKGTPS